MRRERFTLGSSRYHEQPLEDRPEVRISALVITGSAIGGVLAAGLAVFLWVALPAFRGFLVGALVLGAGIGLVLWWKRRSGL